MKKILLSLMITLILISPVWANKLDDRQLKESYAKSADVYTKAETNDTIEAAIAAIPSGGGTAIEDVGTYIGSNTTWEFDTTYDTTAVCIYRNRIYQPRFLFTTVDVSSKTMVIFNTAVNASDEIILISNK